MSRRTWAGVWLAVVAGVVVALFEVASKAVRVVGDLAPRGFFDGEG